MLNDASIFCAGIYSERQGDGRFAVVFGQYLDRDWVHLINNPPRKFERIASPRRQTVPRGAQPADLPSRGDDRNCLYHLPVSTWIVRTYRVVRERSKTGILVSVMVEHGKHLISRQVNLCLARGIIYRNGWF